MDNITAIQTIDYYKNIIRSNAFVLLSNTAKVLYFYMVDYANGKGSTEYPRSVYHILFTDEEFSRALKKLETHGFIIAIHREKQENLYYLENLYYFIDDYKKYKITKKESEEIKKRN